MSKATAVDGAAPDAFQAPLAELSDRLQRLLGGNLVGFTAYGGWRVGDPFLEGELATSVATLRKDDLDALTNLATDGAEYERRSVRAPYFMTADWLAGSCDSFPLELLEVQQTGALLHGEDLFAGLSFERRFVRLACERSLRSELLQLRQGLLRHDAFSNMRPIFRQSMLRLLRTLRGVLFLMGRTAAEPAALGLVRGCGAAAGISLAGMQRFVENPPGRVSLGYYKALYDEVWQLARCVDGMDPEGAGA